jgi:hypothetical protein
MLREVEITHLVAAQRALDGVSDEGRATGERHAQIVSMLGGSRTKPLLTPCSRALRALSAVRFFRLTGVPRRPRLRDVRQRR